MRLKQAIVPIVFSICVLWVVQIIPQSISSYDTFLFYNVENLFDTINDLSTSDGEFTPTGSYQWNTFKYRERISKTANVLANADYETLPVLIGLAEIENKNVLEDLVRELSTNHGVDYEIIHDDSPDVRGIDVAVLYNPSYIQIKHKKTLSPQEALGIRTRDVIYIKASYRSKILHLYVLHAPSRRGGVQKTALKRIKIARWIKEHINQVQHNETEPNVIVMGDFNDEPKDQSLRTFTMDKKLLVPPYRGIQKSTYKYQKKWYAIDLFIVSPRFVEEYSAEAYVCHRSYLYSSRGKHVYPMRAFWGKQYSGGYSDHLPIQLKAYHND